ncbi:hypothetical protein [Rhodoplanes sp. Z2-YC6860]|uniref:hypothetical protein n=1 Tax=Rhodoplanes sp. Z2-YC6860 TaxID=674703 RepID=UPI0012EE5A37|nr:hypothetical protein [Rhodoplanes sp. Z2-YC6860]
MQRGKRVEHFVAQATSEMAAIAAVRKRRGMEKAVIVASGIASDDDLVGLGLKDGEAQRTAVPRQSNPEP